MNTILWILQGILAAMFLVAGIMKTAQPIEKLAKTLTWANRFGVARVRLIGWAELLGAIALIVPWLFSIEPVMTPIAAGGLAIIQVLAVAHHVNHKESKIIPMNLLLFAMAAFVAYGRF